MKEQIDVKCPKCGHINRPESLIPDVLNDGYFYCFNCREEIEVRIKGKD